MTKSVALRLVYFLVFCCTGAWLPKLYDFCLYKGLTGPQSALLLSITPVMMIAVQPFYGMLADKLGYRKTLSIATLLSALSYAGFLTGDGFGWLIAVTIVMSMFYNTIQPVLDSMALQLTQTNTRFSYGILRFYGAAGFSFTALLTGRLVDATGITAIFVVSGVAMLVAFGCTFFLPADGIATQKQVTTAPVKLGIVLRQKSLLFFLFSVFLVSAAATTIWNFYSAYLKANGASDTLVGYGLSLQGLCELPLFYFSARIIIRLGLKTTLLITIMATAVRMVLYGITTNPYAALPIELLHGLSWSLFWVVCVEFVNRLVDEHWRATGQSLLYAAYFGAGAVAGNYWTEFFLSKGKTVAQVFLINAGLVAMVAILLLLLMKIKAADKKGIVENTSL